MVASVSLENHQSFWMASTSPTSHPPLAQNLQVDVAIIGGGLAGITAAMLLKQAGKTVAVLEAELVGTGASGHTTAKVTSLHQLKYATLIKAMGEAKARLYGESNQAAIAKLAELIQTHQIDCDFERKDAYTFADKPDNVESVKAEAEAAQLLGLPATYVMEQY